MPAEPIILLRLRGISKMTAAQRRKVVHWLYQQIDFIEGSYKNLSDDYTARCFGFPVLKVKDTPWQRLKKSAGSLIPKRNSGARS